MSWEIEQGSLSLKNRKPSRVVLTQVDHADQRVTLISADAVQRIATTAGQLYAALDPFAGMELPDGDVGTYYLEAKTIRDAASAMSAFESLLKPEN